MPASPSPFELIHEHLLRIDSLRSIESLLGWDEQVNLPTGSAEHRAEQLAAIADAIHRIETESDYGSLLQRAMEAYDSHSPAQQCVLLKASRDYRESSLLPSSFVIRRAKAQSRAYHAWAEARDQDNFPHFAPHLQEQIELANEYAFLTGATDAYDFWIDKHDPGMTAPAIDALFEPLQAELIPIVRQLTGTEHSQTIPTLTGFDTDAQEYFLHKVLESMGFDFDHGRLDRSLHPFCSGSGADIRMTTRFDANNPLDSLFSSIHEAGHGMYEQGLPYAERGTALGTAAGMGVHESQSRLWENQIARSRPFWNYWEPHYRRAFPQQLAGIDSATLYRTINAVGITPIRVDADEVTYNLHIILRFRLEKALFNGSLAVTDLPDAWRSLARELLNLTLQNDREGVLQDIHWSGGAFGYFPSYTLGNMLAAQLYYALREALPDYDARVMRGDFAPILDWLRTHVHAHGSRFGLMDLSRRATGTALSHIALIRYLKERYLSPSGT